MIVACISACSSRIRWMICASMVTSSAVVGSSAIEQQRIHQQRHRDTRALAHAAAELVRVLQDTLFRVRNADPPHHRQRALALFLVGTVLAPIQDIDHLIAVGQHRDCEVIGSWNTIETCSPR